MSMYISIISHQNSGNVIRKPQNSAAQRSEFQVFQVLPWFFLASMVHDSLEGGMNNARIHQIYESIS